MDKESKPRSLSRREMLFGLVNGIKKNVGSLSAAATGSEASTVEAAPAPDARTLPEAQSAFDAHDIETAIQLLHDYIKTDLDHAPARLLLGYCLFWRGDLIQARVEFDRVLRLEPENRLAALYAGLAHAKQGKLERALLIWQDRTWDDPELDSLLAALALPAADQTPDTAAALAALETYMATQTEAFAPPAVATA